MLAKKTSTLLPFIQLYLFAYGFFKLGGNGE